MEFSVKKTTNRDIALEMNRNREHAICVTKHNEYFYHFKYI